MFLSNVNTRVIARSSTLQYASESVDVRLVGKKIGARYVMEGSLRHAGSQLRIAVQLVDAATGAHLWAENYNRPFAPDESSRSRTTSSPGSSPRSPTGTAFCPAA